MVQITKIIPKVSTSKIMSFLTSKELIVAGAAIIIVPLIINQARDLIAKVPFLRDHFTVAFLVLGFIVSALALVVPAGILRILFLGVGAGLAVTAIAPQIREAIGKVRNR